jgi:uncharacterized peroxidase-related enzyme
MTDFRTAELPTAERAMLEFAVRLTNQPASTSRADVEALRAVGFGDEAIHEVVQIAALFNYYNRLANGLGIDDEPEW